MDDETSGMGAEVGLRKRDEEGTVTATAGAVDRGTTKRGWLIFGLLVLLSTFGVWKILELLSLLV